MAEIIINKYSENGICYPKISLNIRTIPCAITGVVLDQYYVGESVIYDQVVITDKHVWISWLSTSGRRVYMAIKDQITGERWGDCDDVPSTSTGSETIVNEYSESGICYPRMTLNIRDLPCASTGTILDQYFVGESVIYDYVVKTDKYVWISWLSRSGARRYMAVKDQITGERFGDCGDVPGGMGESNTPTGVETIVSEYPESGICYPQMTINIKNIPCSTMGVTLDQYHLGESVIYDYVVITNKYVWISWTSISGRRVYMTVKDQTTGERWGVCEDISGGSDGSIDSGSGIGMPGVKKIFIDAGHGGSDPGALGNGLKEKDIVLSIAQKLTGLFNAKGIQVSHSRYTDTSVGLAERAEMANNWGADLFISIHANALDGSGSAYGTECYTYPNSTAENKRLSADIASSISSKLGTYNRGHREADFAVLRLTQMPSVLIETAFIDNSGDADKLKNRQSDFAQAIFEAIMGADSKPNDVLIFQSQRLPRKNADGTDANDIKTNDFTKDELLNINDLFKYQLNESHEPDKLFYELSDMATSLFSTGEMEDVLLDMINHFKSGSGSNYTNNTLTKTAVEHESTKEFIDCIKQGLTQCLISNNGDLKSLDYSNKESNPLYEYIQANASLPVYNLPSDKINGLTMAIHDTWGTTVTVKDYSINNNIFRGTLCFNIYDHFGLDLKDVEKIYVNLAGFRAWFVLQHYDNYNGKYKPFVTNIDFYVDFECELP